MIDFRLDVTDSQEFRSLYSASGSGLFAVGAFRVVIHFWPRILEKCIPNSTNGRSYVETLFVLLEIPCGGSGIAAVVITGKEYKFWLPLGCLTTEYVEAEIALCSLLM